MSYNYTFDGGQYVLRKGEAPILPPLSEVAIAFDRASGALQKHGPLESVSDWIRAAKAKLRAVGFEGMASDLVMFSGRLNVADLNACLTTTGYVGELFAHLPEGKVKVFDDRGNPIC